MKLYLNRIPIEAKVLLCEYNSSAPNLVIIEMFDVKSPCELMYLKDLSSFVNHLGHSYKFSAATFQSDNQATVGDEYNYKYIKICGVIK